MSFLTLFGIAFGLSMDAVAVSVSNAMCRPHAPLRQYVTSSLMFGLFQGLMPLIGFWVGAQCGSAVRAYDHWIIVLVLGFIGCQMIVEAVRGMRNTHTTATKDFSWKIALSQAVATSLDALAVGVSLALVDRQSVWTGAAIIAGVTAVLSLIAHKIGSRLGMLFQEKAKLCGGIVLILIGIKFLIQDI